MTSSKASGDAAELIARQYLQDRGLDFVCSNYRCRMGEIDLVFRDLSTLVFVEVKFRKNERFGTACEMVNHRKQAKIIRSAQFYLQQHKLTQSVIARFDIIGITPKANADRTGDNYHINWISNAFEATGY